MINLWSLIPLIFSLLWMVVLTDHFFEQKFTRLSSCYHQLSFSLEEINKWTLKLEALNPKALSLRAKKKQLQIQLKAALIEAKINPGKGSLQVAYLRLKIARVEKKQIALAHRQNRIIEKVHWLRNKGERELQINLKKHKAQATVQIPYAIKTIQPQSLSPSYYRKLNYEEKQKSFAKWQAPFVTNPFLTPFIQKWTGGEIPAFHNKCYVTLKRRASQWHPQAI